MSRTPTSDEREATIHRAAIEQFSRRGFAGTSMANIAAAAEMSRPALYQYFRNKGDIFVSAFVALMAEHANRALAALDEPGSTADHLDGFLQRFDGDLWEHLEASPHSEEIIGAKSVELAQSIGEVTDRLWAGLAEYLEAAHPGNNAATKGRRADWLDVLHYSPKGFKFDAPSTEVYRRRLAVLARGVGAEIDAT